MANGNQGNRGGGGDNRGGARGRDQAPGMNKEHEVYRINPETGERETKTITQREYMDSARAEGWLKVEDEDADDTEDETEAE